MSEEKVEMKVRDGIIVECEAYEHIPEKCNDLCPYRDMCTAYVQEAEG